jgi:putative ABC transport system permease protein
MRIRTALLEGILEIRRHWFRSALTVTGIIMGVAALMSMLALTEGLAQGFWQLTMETGGDRKAIIKPSVVPVSQMEKKDISAGLTARDAEILRRNAPLLDWVSPAVTWNNERITRSGREATGRLYAAEEALLDMDRMQVVHGRFLTALDLEHKARVCVLGAKPAAALFDDPEKDAVGSTVSIRGLSFRVIGVFPLYLSQRAERMRASGQSKRQEERRKARGNTWGEWDAFWWKNNMIVVPLSTAQGTFLSAQIDENGVDQGPNRKVTEIQFGFSSFDMMPIAREQAETVMLAAHHGINDFEIQTAERNIEETKQQMRSARATGSIISGISLLVGCLGIVNIMLASIADRLNEIGSRQALGASPADIFLQFLAEATLLGMLGGILGIGASFVLMNFLENISPEDNVPIVTISSVFISLGFSVITGITAGLYPALKAARVPPIQALMAEDVR